MSWPRRSQTHSRRCIGRRPHEMLPRQSSRAAFPYTTPAPPHPAPNRMSTRSPRTLHDPLLLPIRSTLLKTEFFQIQSRSDGLVPIRGDGRFWSRLEQVQRVIEDNMVGLAQKDEGPASRQGGAASDLIFTAVPRSEVQQQLRQQPCSGTCMEVVTRKHQVRSTALAHFLTQLQLNITRAVQLGRTPDFSTQLKFGDCSVLRSSSLKSIA